MSIAVLAATLRMQAISRRYIPIAVRTETAMSEDWRRLADYVVARRVELGMRDRRSLAAATRVTDRTLGKLENGQRVSPSTLAVIENAFGWAPGSCRRILAGGEPVVLSASAAAAAPGQGDPAEADPTLAYLASTPGLPPEVVRGLIALARGWRETEAGDAEGEEQRRA